MKKIVCLLILLIIIIEGFFVYHLNELDSVSGQTILDYTINSHEEVYTIISDYGAEGMSVYKKIQRIDLIFPFVYGFLLVLLLKSIHFDYYLMPFIATAMDLSENTCIKQMLTAYPRELKLVGLLNIFIILKFIVIILSIIIYTTIKLRRRNQ